MSFITRLAWHGHARLALVWLMLFSAVPASKPRAVRLSAFPALQQNVPTPNLKIAFIGDQGLGTSSVAVLNLIKSEGAKAVLHAGDLDYADNPAAWEAQINSVLGADFPYFVAIGNHDELAWRGPSGYQQYLTNRFNRVGITWNGDLGVQSTFYYQGLFFVITAPGISNGFDSGVSDIYIRDQLAADNSIWTICSWHKNMRLMQAGGKSDETGWGVYEEARKGGAVVATAHEHLYNRTHLLSSMVNQTVASTSSTFNLSKGNTFAFVSGLGGHSVRQQILSGPWWASISATTCLAGDPVCQPNGQPGALFGVFNVDGQPNKAFFYFKDINGRIVDSFTVFSNVEAPTISSLAPANAEAGGNGFTLVLNGERFSPSSVVQWNHANRPTTFISTTQLSAEISAADIAQIGSALVTVSGPAGLSNATTFTINPHSPQIMSLAPTSIEAGSDSFVLTVTGDHFLNDSVVRWNGANRPTTFISSTQLTASITAADVSSPGLAAVTVYNSNGSSNGSSFTIAPPSLILFTEANSDRAIVLESVVLLASPFSLTTPHPVSSDQRTRLMFFSPNVSLRPGDGPASISARAEDAQGQVYPLTVEFAGKTAPFDWLNQIVVRLPDDVGSNRDLWVHLRYAGALSNKVRITLR